MILYHGSNVIVKKPTLVTADHTLDFGPGFYVTTNLKQAVKWARIKAKRENQSLGYLSIYEIDNKIFSDATLDIKSFRGSSRAWLRFVIDNRMKEGFKHSYDIVIGSVANDRVYACLNAFENKFMDFGSTIRELKTYTLDDQISFHTIKSISNLIFLESREIKL